MYTWKPGAQCRTSADTVGAICEEMYAEGRLTAENLVEDSRPFDAPLHGEFEWNDTTAAENWRKSQARHIINHLEIRIEEKAPVQAFVKLSDKDHNYHQTEIIIKNADKRQMLLDSAFREMHSFKSRYDGFNELAGVFAAMDEAEEAQKEAV